MSVWVCDKSVLILRVVILLSRQKKTVKFVSAYEKNIKLVNPSDQK